MGQDWYSLIIPPTSLNSCVLQMSYMTVNSVRQRNESFRRQKNVWNVVTVKRKRKRQTNWHGTSTLVAQMFRYNCFGIWFEGFFVKARIVLSHFEDVILLVDFYHLLPSRLWKMSKWNQNKFIMSSWRFQSVICLVFLFWLFLFIISFCNYPLPT